VVRSTCILDTSLSNQRRTIHVPKQTAMPPTLVLVHGAWHSPKHFGPLVKILASHGYKSIAVDCPSTNDTQTLSTFEDDCEAVRAAVLDELDTADVLVVAHSFGGAVTNSALQNLSSAARSASGHVTSALGIAYLCAAVLPAGTAFLEPFGGKPLPIHDLSANDGLVRVGPPGPEHYFYNDLSSSEVAHWASLLRPQSWIAVTNAVGTAEAYMEIPAHYLFCTKDQAIPIEGQKVMVAQAEARSGRKFRTEELDCSHSPFLSVQERTAGFVRRSAGEAC
jgi:pimeloyl-ACP methyl ester carboxylesterase